MKKALFILLVTSTCMLSVHADSDHLLSDKTNTKGLSGPSQGWDWKKDLKTSLILGCTYGGTTALSLGLAKTKYYPLAPLFGVIAGGFAFYKVAGSYNKVSPRTGAFVGAMSHGLISLLALDIGGFQWKSERKYL